MAMAAPPGPSPKGIRAYHGSPHDFDKFSMDKIGTGEGAQAYGHGLYFAENEGTAKTYRDVLSAKKDNLLASYGFSPGGDTNRIKNLIAEHGEKIGNPTKLAKLEEKRFLDDLLALPGMDADTAKRNAREWGKRTKKMFDYINDPQRNSGSMYEVNIDADPDSFLDWDKPLSEQPKNVQDAIFNTYKVRGWKGDNVPLREVMQQYEAGGLDPMKAVEPHFGNASGHNLYSALSDQMGAIDWPIDAPATLRGQFRANASAKTAQALKEAGIPGIKYLDAGSRGAGDGTRNYVVFDDRLISIVRKYGIAGASAMLGYNILDGMDPAQAEELKQIEGNQ